MCAPAVPPLCPCWAPAVPPLGPRWAPAVGPLANPSACALAGPAACPLASPWAVNNYFSDGGSEGGSPYPLLRPAEVVEGPLRRESGI